MNISIEREELALIVSALFDAVNRMNVLAMTMPEKEKDALYARVSTTMRLIHKIEEQADNADNTVSIPRVTVKVSGGLVQAAYANAAVDVEVYDLDVSDFPDEQDWAEHDEAAEQMEKIERDPAFHCAW